MLKKLWFKFFTWITIVSFVLNPICLNLSFAQETQENNYNQNGEHQINSARNLFDRLGQAL